MEDPDQPEKGKNLSPHASTPHRPTTPPTFPRMSPHIPFGCCKPQQEVQAKRSPQMLTLNYPTTTTKQWHTSTQSLHHYSTKNSTPTTFITVITATRDEKNQPHLNSNSKAGKINRDVLSSEGRTKLNLLPDREFYSYPRFVTHVDDRFISTLTSLYRERLRSEFEVLDLMSSWVSHLPKEVKYRRVVGHGLNAQELARNDRLDYFFVKDLNLEHKLEFDSCSFDAVLCTVSVQYLQQPEKVFAEIFRVLRPGGVFIVSFSNRMFYDKAITAWRDATPYSRVQLVVQYFQCIDGFTQPEVIKKLSNVNPSKDSKGPLSSILGLFNLFSNSDPFYTVVAYKNFRPIYE